MTPIELQGALPPGGSLGLLLGSFDPPHLGHQLLAGALLERCGGVLLLVPARHFDKVLRPGQNASFADRLEMLRLVAASHGGRLVAGLAHEVLYLRLCAALEELAPGRPILLAMGDESYRGLCASADYYRRAGLLWTAREEAQLEDLRRRVLVFARHRTDPALRRMPEPLRGLASREIRARAAELRARAASRADWQAALRGALLPEVIDYIYRTGLYRSATATSALPATARRVIR